MSFDELLDAVRQLMERDGRVAYRVLKRRFELDDEDIEDIKADLIDAKRLAKDEDGRVLVWIGDAGRGSDPAPSSRPENTHAVPDTADRRLITVMFCDIVYVQADHGCPLTRYPNAPDVQGGISVG